MVTSKLLKDLNPEQKRAVTHLDGPLLVVAGAGTGKTTVISRRIAWLIEQGIAKPEEILALTFTEKAAGEMESRVDVLVPYGVTGATIATFHSFGDRILREHALDLGLPPEFRILGSDEQELFLSSRFDEIDGIEELRPMTGPRKYVNAVLRVISRAKDELVSPEKYRDFAEKFLKDALDDETKRAAWRQLEIAIIYAAYEIFKADEGVLDFGDQIKVTYDFLQREPKLLKTLHQRYKYILVDEFQDTNIGQYEMVKLLLSPEQNLTVVGDDDQAIYKFRGAAVSNILRFLEDFPSAHQVVLAHNYRSHQSILDAAYALIQHNNPDRLEAKLGINKHLTGTVDGIEPKFTWYVHEADELDGLVASLKDRLKTAPANQVAILVRSNNSIGPIAAALKQAGIPYTTSSDYGFVQLPEVRGIIAFFSVLVHPYESLPYTKLLLSPYYQFDPLWILALNDSARSTNRTFLEVLSDDASEAWSRLSNEGSAALRAFRESLVDYRRLIAAKDAGEILYQFLKDRGVLERPEPTTGHLPLFRDRPEEEQLAMIQNIAAVFDAIKRYGDSGRDRFSLAFVDQLPELLSSVVPPSVDLGPEVAAVQIATVHAAKGLEFQIVFLPQMTSDRFPARNRHEALSLPSELIAEILPTGDEHLEEERRLAYVALTRAKGELILSGSQKTGEGVRSKKPSPFVLEALKIVQPPAPISQVSQTDRIHQFAARSKTITTLSRPEHDGVLFLSPAMIETYQQDPYNFYWRYVLKAPMAPNRYVHYGTAIHAGIETYYRLQLQKKKPTIDQLITRYHQAWKSEGFESRADEERQKDHGEEILKSFFDRAQTEALPTLVEDEFVLIVPGARIRGRVDAIFETAGEIRDFKTSQVDSQKAADQKIKDNLPIRIYALAYLRRFGKLPSQLTLDFVETSLKANLHPTEAMLQETEAFIQQTIADIRAQKFDPNPNNPFKDYE